MKSKETKGTTKEKLRGKERQKYYYEKMIKANIPLEEGERAVQMVDHNDYYFVTNHGRVFSVYYENECIDLGQQPRKSKNMKQVSGSVEQLSVKISIKNEGLKNCRTGRLVAYYFPEPVFNPMNESELECHHIEGYDKEKGRLNNYSDKLQWVGANAHKSLLTPFANAEVTPDGTTPEFSEKMFKKLQEIETDEPFMIARTINADRKECTSVRGIMLTQEQLNMLLHNPSIQAMMAAGYTQRINELIEKSKKNPYDCTPEEIRELINYSKSMEGEMKA